MIQQPGWLLPTLLQYDRQYQERWTLWQYCIDHQFTPAKPEPIQFLDIVPTEAISHVQACFEVIPQHRSIVHLHQVLPFFTHWLLYAFGYPGFNNAPDESGWHKGASTRLASTFDIEIMLRYPCDVFGAILAEQAYGKGSRFQFYPTPQAAANAIADVGLYAASNRAPLHLYDPCVGTGRLMLAASNWAICATGWEIDALLLKCAICNLLLYAPFLALPLPWLPGDLVCGDVILSQGRSMLNPQRTYCEAPQFTSPSENTTVEINGIRFEQTKGNTLQGKLF